MGTAERDYKKELKVQENLRQQYKLRMKVAKLRAENQRLASEFHPSRHKKIMNKIDKGEKAAMKAEHEFVKGAKTFKKKYKATKRFLRGW